MASKTNFGSFENKIPADYVPSLKEVDRYSKIHNGLDGYSQQEKALDKLFFELCPKNTDIEDVLLKCSTLNDFYSTNIFDIYKLAKHIMGILNLDERMNKCDLDLVDEIANASGHRVYSFATKYCSHHHPKEYAIYDNYVERVLLYFQKRDKFFKDGFNGQYLRTYKQFNKVLNGFCERYNIPLKSDMKILDRYLWQLGKKYFSPYPIQRTEVMEKYIERNQISILEDPIEQEFQMREIWEAAALENHSSNCANY